MGEDCELSDADILRFWDLFFWSIITAEEFIKLTPGTSTEQIKRASDRHYRRIVVAIVAFWIFSVSVLWRFA